MEAILHNAAVWVCPLARFACSADFAAYCLQRVNIPARLAYETTGKPYLAGYPLCVSLSHSRTYRALALSSLPVGVDIELMRPVDASRIARRFFSPEEALRVEQGGAPVFYDLWCAKESCAKLTGLPLAAVLRRPLPVRDCCFEHTQLYGNALALCARRPGIFVMDLT